MLFSRKRKEEKRKCVLVVDDVATIRMIAGAVFRNAGYEVFEARNGDEALESARIHLPDLIVMDVMMPIKGGIEALKEIREDDALKSIPVIMLTGSEDLEILEEAASLQATDYIIKDNLKTVTERLQKHLESS